MRLARRIRLFVDRHPLAGPVVWVLSAQFFLAQFVVASAWRAPSYSWRHNSISDLANSRCGEFDGRYVCSPLSAIMNVSLVLLGLSMALGSVLVYQHVRHSGVGFFLMAAAGVGAILVGVFPENTIDWAHTAGADLAFVLSNIALIVFGLRWHLPRWLRWYGIASGVVGLVALYLFLSHHRFFLGLGGMERLVAYPMVIWLIVCGLYLSAASPRSAVRHLDVSAQ